MTTQAAAAQHQDALADKGYAVYNPHNKSLDELPIIYGFNNGGSPEWYEAVLLSQDGECLGSHICSHEGYMRHDLGILEGTRDDRHETFRTHYPDGYRMDFVGFSEAHKGLTAAIEAHKARHPKEHEAQP